MSSLNFRIVFLALLLCVLLAGTVNADDVGPAAIKYTNMNDVLKIYELNNIVLNQHLAIGNLEVYWNQRRVGDAIVEGANTVVQFNPVALEYVELQSLRPDVVDSQILSPVIPEAEIKLKSQVIGTPQAAQLYILKPGSQVFPVTSDPTHPSWVVYSYDGLYPDGSNKLVISIFDSVTGDFLGQGTPPPYTALSINGPDWGVVSPCPGIWPAWMNSAKTGFDAMGYSTEAIDVATLAQIQSHIQSGGSAGTALFYELDHGGSTSFHNTCTENLAASAVGTWMTGYTKMPFSFIGSCGGLCSNADDTFSYEFRKDSTTNTAAVGYCHMDWTGSGSETYDCTQCWGNSIPWQNDLFNRLKNGETVKDAFDHALADYPMCGSGSTCMRLDGDPNLKLVPVVSRGTLPTANAGPDQTVEQTSKAGTAVTLDGSGSVEPNSGATLTYAWTWTGGSATGVNPTASFPLGTTLVTLTVDDGYGSPLDVAERTDTVTITVTDKTKPVITVPADVTVEQTSAAGTPVTLPAATATDICDTAPVITSDAPAVFPLGTTTVTFTATDASGNSATGKTKVTVVDTTPPVITVPADVTVEQTSAAGTPVTLPAATATDICDTAPVITSDAPAVFPLGTTTVTFTATDASGNSATGKTKVTVVDTTPPVISVRVTPDTLWSPNHKMTDITATVTVSDICDVNPTVVLTSVTSSEPANALGDGTTASDIQGTALGTADYLFQLRAERQGMGNDRVYTITYTATDFSGNSASAIATVTVPKSKSPK